MKLAKGERRPSRVNYDEPAVPIVREVEPPANLRGEGLKEWLTQFAVLRDAGALKANHLEALGDYCRRLQDLRDVEAEAREARDLYERIKADAAGGKEIDLKVLLRLLANIDSVERRKLAQQAQVNTLRRELGATPSSLSAVKVPGKPGESKSDKVKRYLSALPGGRA